MLAGTGGSETYTAGHVRELLRRGIEAQVVTIGHGTKKERQDAIEMFTLGESLDDLLDVIPV